MAEEKFLVTGAMGCIGAWTLAHLVWDGVQAIGLDVSRDRHRLDLLLTPDEQERIHFVQVDLADQPRVIEAFQAHGVTRVVHLAALQIPFCKAEPARGAQVNVTGTVNVFEAARLTGIRHLAYASSVAVYGPPEAYPPGPLAPEALPAPRTLYGVYKVANEGAARVYWADHGLGSVGLRPYTVYGLGRDQGLTSDLTQAMLAAVRGEAYEIGFGGAMQVQWASDVARLFIAAARGAPEGARVFNLDTPSTRVEEVIGLIREVRPGAQITHKEAPLPFPARFAPGELAAYLPDFAETPLAEGVRRTMAAFEARGRAETP